MSDERVVAHDGVLTHCALDQLGQQPQASCNMPTSSQALIAMLQQSPATSDERVVAKAGVLLRCAFDQSGQQAQASNDLLHKR